MTARNNTLGQRIAASRRHMGLSQRQLAALVNLRPNTISMYENDDRKPSVDTIIKLSKTLHVSTDYLLLDREGKFLDISELDEKNFSLLCELIEALRQNQSHSDPV